MARHGPHQDAQKSTTTGIFVRAMKRSNVWSSSATGAPSKRSAPHLPHFGASPRRAAGTRFAVRHFGHADWRKASMPWMPPLTPQPVGGLHDQLELAPLVVHGDLVAMV